MGSVEVKLRLTENEKEYVDWLSTLKTEQLGNMLHFLVLEINMRIVEKAVAYGGKNES